MKTCPFCAEQIQEAAIVCKHCGKDLPALVGRPAPRQQSALGRFFDWLRFGWIRPQIQCRQCRQTGQVRTMKGAVKKGFCGNCRTQWRF